MLPLSFYNSPSSGSRSLFRSKYGVPVIAVVCCLLWGSAFPFVKIGYQLFGIGIEDTWGKILFAGYRFFLAGLFLFLVALFSGQKMVLARRHAIHVFFLGLILTTGQYIFFYLGLSRTTGVNAAILNATSVFFSILLAHFFLEQDKLNSAKFLGIILGFAGVILSNYSPEHFFFRFSWAGDGLIVLSQLAGAVGAIYVKRLSGSIPILVLMAYQMLWGSLLLILPAASAIGLFPFPVSFRGGLVLVYLFLLSAVAFSLWNTLIKYHPVGKISMFLFLIPVFGAFLSAGLLAGEGISPAAFLALLLVSAGIVAVYGQEAFGFTGFSRRTGEG